MTILSKPLRIVHPEINLKFKGGVPRTRNQVFVFSNSPSLQYLKPFSRSFSTREFFEKLSNKFELQQKSSFNNTILFNFQKRIGVPYLLGEWKKLVTKKYIKEDLVAGATVAALALPLSLAISVASGVPAQVGLISAIVGGTLCAIFGGSCLAVCGPAAAMSVLISSIAFKFGLTGVIAVTFISGVLQIVTGFFKLGKYIRFVPTPIIEGFTAGIGSIIAITQLPKALGITLPESKGDTNLLNIIQEVYNHLGHTNMAALGLTSLTLAIILGLPKIIPKTKSLAPLIAIATSTILNSIFHLGAPILGNFPHSFSLPTLTPIPLSDMPSLIGSALIVYGVLTLESLLSAMATEKMMLERNENLKIEKEYNVKHNPNQELIGQGFGNMVVAMCGGIPVTGVIARSATNVQVGAMTRRSAIIHAVVLAGAVSAFTPVLSHIPLCALSGLLFSVSARMLHPKHLKHIFKINKIEVLPYLSTTSMIIATNLLTGVQFGFGVQIAMLLATRKQRSFNVSFRQSLSDNLLYIDFSGAINFLSITKIQKLENEAKYQISLLRANNIEVLSKPIVNLDFTNVTMIDMTGGEEMNALFDILEEEECEYRITGLKDDCRDILVNGRASLRNVIV